MFRFFPYRAMLNASATVFFVVLLCNLSLGQTAIPSTTPVVQNFDGMAAGTTLPSNWRIHQNSSPAWSSGTATLSYQASSGSPTTGGTYNWGSAAGERSAGVMTSGSFSSPSSLMGWYQNTNSNNITQLTISYDCERYRINTSAASVQFYYSTDGSTWTSVSAGDIAAASLPTGASAYSFSPPQLTVNVSGFNITGLNIANGGNIYLRWNLNTTGSSSQGIGIDNVSVTATFAACAPPSDPTGTITPAANPSCGPTTLSYSGASANIYWQTSSTGTSTTNPTTSAYNVTTSGTYYVRAYNGSCWSTNSLASPAITINTVPTITGSTTVTVGGTITLSGSPGGGTWSSSNTSVATVSAGGVVTGVAIGTSNITYTLSGCSSFVTVNVTPAPCLTSNFDSGSLPAGWTNSSITFNTNGSCNSTNQAVFNASGDYFVTNFADFPTSMTFTYRRSSDATAWSLLVQIGSSSTGPWTDIQTITGAVTTCQTANIDLSAYSSYSGQYFKIIDTRSSGTNERYIDDFNVYCGSCTTPITQASQITFSSIYSSQVTVSWTNGTGAKRIVLINTVNSFTNPVNGTDPAANSTYGGSGQQVVYNGSSNNVLVNGLSPSTTYYFRVYEANCTGTSIVFNTSTATNNPNSVTTNTTAPPSSTVLIPGDIAVLGVNSNIAACSGGSPGDDEISFVCFKDITAGTVIDITDNGWERCHTGQWGNSEGFLSIQRTSSTITAGTVITIRFIQSSPYITGIYPDNNWSIVTRVGPMIMNSNGDQLYFMQGGVWNNGTSTCNPIGYNPGSGILDCQNATYTGGSFLFAFNTNDQWLAGVCDAANSAAGDGRSQNSGLMTGMDCFNMTPNVATDYIKYTGPQTPANQIEWIGRINDPTNWSSFTDCNTYYAGTPQYELGYILDITATGIDPTYNWYGNKNTQWFECANWGTLRVPTSFDHVVIPNSTNVKRNIELVAGENAACRTLTMNHPGYEIQAGGDPTKLLSVNGNLTINAGLLRFDDGNPTTADGTINIKGSWINNSNFNPFVCGNSTVNFIGNSQSVQSPNLGYENFYNFNIQSPAVVNPGNFTLNISGNWTNYNSSGFNENNSTVSFNGTSAQTISTTGGETFYNMTVDNNSAGVGLSSSVTITNNLTQQNGYISINSQTLTLNGDLLRNNGLFRGTSSSTLEINGSGMMTAGIMFENSYQTVGTFTLNRSSGWVYLLSNLSTETALNMTAGELDLFNKTLGINGIATGTGLLNGTINSAITVGGSGNAGTIYFSNFNNILGSFTTNRTSGNITIGSPDLRIQTQLTLTNGLITTGSNKIIVINTDPTSVSGQNNGSYINGNLRRYVSMWGSYDFPLGTSSYYEASNLNINNNLSASYIDAWFNAPHVSSLDLTSLGLYINGTQITTLLDYGFWTFLPNPPGTIDYNVTLTSRGHTNGGSLASQHTVVKRPNNFSDWAVYQTNHNNGTQSGTGTSPITASLSNMTSFCDYAIARSSINPLPVELISLTAKMQENDVLIEWATLTEINNSGFTVLKSNDSKSFFKIGEVEGSGFSSSPKFYSFTDPAPFKGYNFYKLIQKDYDGNSSESQIVSVTNNRTGELNIIAQDGIISIYGNDEITGIRIFDITGREIVSELISESIGVRSYFADIKPGRAYLINIMTVSGSEVRKIVGN